MTVEDIPKPQYRIGDQVVCIRGNNRFPIMVIIKQGKWNGSQWFYIIEDDGDLTSVFEDKVLYKL